MRKVEQAILKWLSPRPIPQSDPEDAAYSFVEPSIRSIWAKGARAHHAGYVSEAISFWIDALVLRDDLYRRYGKGPDFLFFGGVWSGVIGHMAVLCYYIKAVKLGLAKRRDLYLDAHAGSANAAYLEYFAEYFTIIYDDKKLASFDLSFRCEPPSVMRLGRKWYFLNDAIGIIENKWRSRRLGALFSLTDHHRIEGERFLRQKGVPEGAWFVAMHVREKGRLSTSTEVDSIRNCRVSDYIKAIQSITASGGWVVRVGYENYEPLPDLPQVVDYATQERQDGLLDVYFLAAAKFVIATNSGPAWVAVSFGTPVVFTNWAPVGINPFWKDAIVLKKTLYSLLTDLPLTSEQQEVEPISQLESISRLKELGYGVYDNNPEDINAAVRRALSKYIPMVPPIDE